MSVRRLLFILFLLTGPMAGAGIPYPADCAKLLESLVDRVVSGEFSARVIKNLGMFNLFNAKGLASNPLQKLVDETVTDIVRNNGGRFTPKQLMDLFSVEVYLQSTQSEDRSISPMQARYVLWNLHQKGTTVAFSQSSLPESSHQLLRGYRASIRRLVDRGVIRIGVDYTLSVN